MTEHDRTEHDRTRPDETATRPLNLTSWVRQHAPHLDEVSNSNPNATLQKSKIGTGKRLSSDERAKLRKQREKEARRKKRDGRK